MKYRNYLQQLIYKIINPVVHGMIKMGITPNFITTTGLLLNIAAAVVFVYAAFAGEDGRLLYVGWAGGIVLFAGLFDMMDGVISGKTGFTADAGYCYVCACEKEGKLFIVALLGCGWPNNKSYKWSDTRKLLEYGNENYFYTTYWKNPILQPVPVKNAVNGDMHGTIMAQGICQVSEEDRNREILLGKKEKITYTVEMEKSLEAPVQKGQKIGEVVYYLEGKKFCSYPVIAEKNIEKITYQWCVEQVFHNYFH